MKKTVLFCPTDTWGGVEKNVRLRAQFLSEKGYRVYVVLLKDTFEDRFSDLDKVIPIPIKTRGGDLNLLVIRRYYRLLKEIRPDSVFAALKKDWWLVSAAAALARVPRILLYLGIKRDIRTGLKYRAVFRWCKAKVIVNSDSLKQHLLDTCPYFGPDNLFRIYNGFPLPEPQGPSFLKTRLNLPEDTYLIGCAGRLSPQKGFDLLPDILAKSPGNFHVVQVGEGPFEAVIKGGVSASPQASRIHFLGHQKDMDLFFRSIDVFLLCSRREGMANVLNEALSYGKPVVSTRVDGSEELLDHGKYGLLTDIDDTQAMAHALGDIASGKASFDPAGQRGRIAETFSMARMIHETERLFFGVHES